MENKKNYEEILNSVEEKVNQVISDTAIPDGTVSKSLDADDVQKVDAEEVKPEPPATEQEEAEMKEETATEEESKEVEEVKPEPPATEQEEAEMKEETATDSDEEVAKSVEAEEAPAEDEEVPEKEAEEAPAEEVVEKSMIPAELVVKMFSHISEGLETIAKSINSPKLAEVQETVETVTEAISKSADTVEEDLEGKSVTYAPKESIAKSVTADNEEVVEDVEEVVENTEPEEESFDYDALAQEANSFFFGNITRLNGDDDYQLRSYLMGVNHGKVPTQETVENIQRIIKL